jgi:glycerate 2-kinase
MIPIRFQPGLPEREQQLATDVIRTVLRAADPERAMWAHLAHIPKDMPTHILAFGKASIGMCAGAIDALGSSFARATVLAPEANTINAHFKSKLVACYPCDHPLPTERNVDATQQLLEHARSIPADHRVLVLISGGSSAMLCLPQPRATLGQIRQITKDMLARGASIQEINASRAPLETLKAGGLASELMNVQDRYCFLISDVIGDDPSVIGSGPMHDAFPPRTPHMIIASNTSVLDALAAWSATKTIDCFHIDRGVTVASSEAGRFIAERLTQGSLNTPCAVALGGETTVNTQGSDGIGGPSLETTLSAARSLGGQDFDWSVIGFTTDGIDGPSGVAGCALTRSMLSAPIKLQGIESALKHHDTLSICDTLGATIRTGPTGTNVNDVAIAIRWD